MLRAALYAVRAAATVTTGSATWESMAERAKVDRHLAVVAPDDLAAYLSSLHDGTGAWRSQLWAWAQVPGMRRGLVGFVTCTASDLVAEEHLFDPPSILRMNAVLDILGVAYGAQDVHASYDEVAASLSEATVSPGLRKAVTGGSYAVAGVAGMHGMTGGWITGIIGKAGNYVTSRSARWDATVEHKAAVVTCCLILLDEGRNQDVDDVLRHLSCELTEVSRDVRQKRQRISSLPTDGSAETQRRQLAGPLEDQERALRLLRTALDVVTSTPRDSTGTVSVPETVGLSLPDARRIAEACGLSVHAKDVTMRRGIRREQNWAVVQQHPAAGTELARGSTLVLRAKRLGEVSRS